MCVSIFYLVFIKYVFLFYMFVCVVFLWPVSVWCVFVMCFCVMYISVRPDFVCVCLLCAFFERLFGVCCVGLFCGVIVLCVCVVMCVYMCGVCLRLLPMFLCVGE